VLLARWDAPKVALGEAEGEGRVRTAVILFHRFESDMASTYEGSYGNHLLARGKEIITWS
jgi:hypothetical protein